MQVSECMNDSSHVFKGRHLDGLSCPICGGPVLPKPYDKEKDKNLPYYRDLKKQYNKKFIQSECLRCEHVQRNECNNKAIEVFVCEECNGASVDVWRKNKYLSETHNQIEIIMTYPNKPPKIKLNGKDIDAIIDLQYNYETKDCKSSGQHNFTVKYFDKDSECIRTVSTNKIREG
ncbi:hypothetical protein [Lysinibacillus sphaericus]|uniref:hypothetical protein n=1 Tax=Lysinibacillus sphaericus TaxID=1421 RepID=UPI003D7F7F73